MDEGNPMSHVRAVSMMVLVTLLWSTAGVVSRQFEVAQGFEVTFWRSAFTVLALSVALTGLRGVALWRGLWRSPRAVWLSGLCWAVMFTAFMLALTMTRVANVLVTMAIGPLVTALFARLFLHHRLPARTWAAIAVAGAGIAWMFGHEVQAADARSLLGMAVALAVPLAAAVNFTVLQHISHGEVAGESQDMLPAVLIGALLSSLVTLPLAWPLQASAHDLVLLAGLGGFQLALPCLLVVGLTRILPAPEIALLGLLEVVFGVLWAWVGAGEAPGPTALTGGALVLGALVGNELLGWRRGGQG
ncbi:DMT family transporter [Sphaerotilus sp.]|uniref:DMT family transporter n=1 Tax=Sphaerotilus sp. TaxID=2093942 RepID=UPI0025E0D7B4|nr:DMT family transporter [Sphaerotilus sp.]